MAGRTAPSGPTRFISRDFCAACRPAPLRSEPRSAFPLYAATLFRAWLGDAESGLFGMAAPSPGMPPHRPAKALKFSRLQ